MYIAIANPVKHSNKMQHILIYLNESDRLGKKQKAFSFVGSETMRLKRSQHQGKLA